MKVYVYPSDKYGCGYFRIIWPAEILQSQGHDVTIVDPGNRSNVGVNLNSRGDVVDAFCPPDADVLVLQRITHEYLVQAIPFLRRKGVAVIVDIDDDLTAIHPDNPAFHPKNERYAWSNIVGACRDATLVTTTAEALASKYAPHGRARILNNYLPDMYYQHPRKDHTGVGWPATIHSHPNDPQAVGGAIQRLLGAHPDITFTTIGTSKTEERCRRAFNISRINMLPGGTCQEWPGIVATLGIGIAPLANTRFNRGKSFLKPMEMSALGVPWVASPRAEYQKFHDMTGAGVLAKKPAAWFTALDRLISDESYRIEMSERGIEAAKDFKIANNAWRWAEAWSDAVKIERS